MVRKIVLGSAVLLLLAWIISNFGVITGDREGVIRLVLGALFAIVIMFRWKESDIQPLLPGWTLPLSAVLGASFAVGGLIFRIHQFEWLGLILVLFACLRWSLLPKFGRDIFLALFLLYWIHPLPGNVFGRMEMEMQALSVKGAEWFLQCLNQRVWADGSILQTGFRAFEVEEACSGLRTSVTVFLCTIGVGILFRLRWLEIAAFAVLGLIQVLVLNVFRIALMVFLAAGRPPGWNSTFLHDTLGLFLLASILLTQLEMSWWKVRRVVLTKRQEGVETGELEALERATMLPRFWRVVGKWGWLFVLIALAMAAATFAIYKHRPAHRAAMMASVIV